MIPSAGPSTCEGLFLFVSFGVGLNTKSGNELNVAPSDESDHESDDGADDGADDKLDDDESDDKPDVDL